MIDFLQFCKGLGRKVHLVTNAHSKTLDIKMRRTDIGSYFDRIVCSGDIGLPKEEPLFWNRLEKLLSFDRKRTLLADDNENVLQAAAIYGMGVLIFVSRPSSRAEVLYSKKFASIVYFNELIV